MHFPGVPGLAGDHSEHRVRDPARFVLLDVDSKQKDNCYYIAGRGCEIVDRPANWRHMMELEFFRTGSVAILRWRICQWRERGAA